MDLTDTAVILSQKLTEGGDGTSYLLRIDHDTPHLVLHRHLPDGLSSLVGWTAPDHWAVLGLHTTGDAQLFETTSSGALAEPVNEPCNATLTTLLDRDSNFHSVVRHGSTVVPTRTRPQGFVPDTICRALRSPTPAPAADTTELWILVWLNHVVELVGGLGDSPLVDWEVLAGFHPYPSSTAVGPNASDGPLGLAYVTHDLAKAWPWSRLRQEPEILPIPAPGKTNPTLPERCIPSLTDTRITNWMDNGMFSRCVLHRMPSLARLVAQLQDTLPLAMLGKVREAIVCCGLPWPNNI